MGEAIVADVALTLAALLELCKQSDREAPPARPAPESMPASDPMSSSTALRALAEVFPRGRDRRARGALGDPRAAKPAAPEPSRQLLLLRRRRTRLRHRGGDRRADGEPSRPVVCVLGEGSAQYAIQSLWTAAAYQVPLTYLVLRNDEYSILKWFAMMEDVQWRPRPRPAGARLRRDRRGLRRCRTARAGREQLSHLLSAAFQALWRRGSWRRASRPAWRCSEPDVRRAGIRIRLRGSRPRDGRRARSATTAASGASRAAAPSTAACRRHVSVCARW